MIGYGTSLAPKVVVSVLLRFFSIWLNAICGFWRIDDDAFNLLRGPRGIVFGQSRFDHLGPIWMVACEYVHSVISVENALASSNSREGRLRNGTKCTIVLFRSKKQGRTTHICRQRRICSSELYPVFLHMILSKAVLLTATRARTRRSNYNAGDEIHLLCIFVALLRPVVR